MKFGEAIKSIFEAHYQDLESDDRVTGGTRYTNAKLILAIDLLPWKWKKSILSEFHVISNVLERSILKCPHIEYTTPWPERHECNQCGSHRSLELEDNDPHSYNEHKQWTKWRV